MTMRQPRTSTRGFTLAEILTALIVIAVLAALAVPMWHTHLLRTHRADARAALIAAQEAQDKFFGVHARYARGPEITAAPPAGLGLVRASEHGFYDIEVTTTDDGLGFVAAARASKSQGPAADSRCVEFSLDQNGRRRAIDSKGEDRAADCWR
jgi:type IV pilus assembly protein PilE